MNVVHIDDLDAIEMSDGFVWRPVRRRFGIKAFGTNAYTPGASGQIVEEHTEGQLGHEEMYLVLRGRVRFTIDGDEHELGPGQLVFVRDPSLRRDGVALTDDAAVLAVGGKPGQAHEISAWEYAFAASPHIEAGRWDEAVRVMQEGLDEKPGDPAMLYNLACVEARAGRSARPSPGRRRCERALRRGRSDGRGLRLDPLPPAFSALAVPGGDARPRQAT